MKPTKCRMTRPSRRGVLAALLLLAGNLLFFLTIWMATKYDKVTLDQFVYQMKSSAVGANSDLINSAAVRVGLFGVALTALIAANPQIKNPNLIYPGDRVNIP